MTGLSIGQHGTSDGLQPVFQLQPDEGIDAAGVPGTGQNRLHATDRWDLGQQLQKRLETQDLFLFQR
jgi:hypothetical protein